MIGAWGKQEKGSKMIVADEVRNIRDWAVELGSSGVFESEPSRWICKCVAIQGIGECPLTFRVMWLCRWGGPQTYLVTIKSAGTGARDREVHADSLDEVKEIISGAVANARGAVK